MHTTGANPIEAGVDTGMTARTRIQAEKAARRMALRSCTRACSRGGDVSWLGRLEGSRDPLMDALNEVVAYGCPDEAKTPAQLAFSTALAMDFDSISRIEDGEDLGVAIGEIIAAADKAEIAPTTQTQTGKEAPDAGLQRAYTRLIMKALEEGYQEFMPTTTLHQWQDAMAPLGSAGSEALERLPPETRKALVGSLHQCRLGLASRTTQPIHHGPGSQVRPGAHLNGTAPSRSFAPGM